MLADDSFKVISVTGAHSKVGKTTLCSILLKELNGFGAIKFTKTSLYASVVEDINILKQKGKDTSLFLESGAERVLWVQSPYNELENVLEIAISKMIDLKGVIVEGNSPVDFLNPYLVIFIIGTKEECKPSAVEIIGKADIVIVNSEKQAKQHTFSSEICRKDAKVFRIDLIKMKGEIDGLISFVKERVGRGSH